MNTVRLLIRVMIPGVVLIVVVQAVYAGFIGPQFPISRATDHQYHPAVAYNSSANQFLLAWTDSRNSSTTGADIYGRRYAP